MRPRAPSRALPRVAAWLALGSILVGCGHRSREPAPAVATNEGSPTDPASAAEATGADGMPRGYARPVPLASRVTEDGSDAGAGTSSNGLANPGPTSNPCTRDDECITHRCNPAFHRCAFPCVSDRDCTTGNYCYTSVVAVCLPRSEAAGGDGGSASQ
jgi:hypothetical protein